MMWIDSITQTYPGQLVGHYVGNVSSVLAKCVLLWMVSTILLISSAVLYFTFHYSMMPTMLATLPVHFQFSPCYGEQKDCSYPMAELYLLDSNASPLLHPHVHYTISLEMDMPESRANKDTGMFMVQLNLTSISGKLVGSSSRPNILHYRSGLHRALRTLFFSPLLLTEYAHEQQRLSTELFSAYLVQEEEPPTRCRLQLRSLSVQLYSARLRVHARLSGLRRLMYHYPLVTGVLGTAATFCSLAAVFLLIWLKSTDLPVQLRTRLRRMRTERAPRVETLGAVAAGAADDAAKPGGSAAPPEDRADSGSKGQGTDGAPAPATCRPATDTKASGGGREVPPPAQAGCSPDETTEALRQRTGRTVVEY